MQSVPVESSLNSLLETVAFAAPVALTEPAPSDVPELVTSAVLPSQLQAEAKEDVSIEIAGDDWAYFKSDN